MYFITPSETLYQVAVSTERSIAGLTAKKITISDGEIAYLEGGTGETLLLLHGFGANKDNWNRLAKHLTSDYHVIAIDLPGFGDSFKNIELDHDVSSQVKWLREFTTRLKLRQFHLGGNSMGGYVAGNYAAGNYAAGNYAAGNYATQYSVKVTTQDATSFKQNILSLWLIDPLGVATAPRSEMFEMVRNKQRPVVLAKNKPEYETLLSYVFHHPPFMPDFMITELAKQAEIDFDLHQKIFNDIHHLTNFEVNLSSPLELSLAQLTIPVLITWGDKDRIVNPLGAQRLADLFTMSQIDIMEGIGHLPMIEDPSATAESFLSFQLAQ